MPDHIKKRLAEAEQREEEQAPVEAGTCAEKLAQVLAGVKLRP